MKVNLDKVCDCKVKEVYGDQYPDYVDAFIDEGWIETDAVLFCLMPNAKLEKNGKFYRKLTGAELDWINTQERAFVLKKTLEQIN